MLEEDWDDVLVDNDFDRPSPKKTKPSPKKTKPKEKKRQDSNIDDLLRELDLDEQMDESKEAHKKTFSPELDDAFESFGTSGGG